MSIIKVSRRALARISRAECSLWQARFTGRAGQARSIQGKAARAQEARKTLAFGVSGLPRLVFRPTVKRRVTKDIGRTLLLARQRVSRIAAPVIVINSSSEAPLVIMVHVHGRRERKAHADMSGGGGIADTQPCYREYLVRQTQDVGDRVGVIANDADRTAPETRDFGSEDEGLQDQRRVNRGVEEPFELTVLVSMAAQFADPLEAVGVAAKDQNFRRVSDPRHIGHQRRETIAAPAVSDPYDGV